MTRRPLTSTVTLTLFALAGLLTTSLGGCASETRRGSPTGDGREQHEDSGSARSDTGSTAAEDTGAPEDTGRSDSGTVDAGADAGGETDGGDATDAGERPDVLEATDAGEERDQGEGLDLGEEQDAGHALDQGGAPDAGPGGDAGEATDGGSDEVDASGGADAGQGEDAGHAVDGGGQEDAGGGTDLARDAGEVCQAGATRCASERAVEVCAAGVWVQALECPEANVCEDGGCVAAPRCGDNDCDANEDCEVCEADCACGDGQVCQAGVCEDEPPCDDGCGETWLATCSGDGFGYRLCLPDPEAPGCTTPSRRVPCGEGRSCAEGVCSGRCLSPEVLFLVDRSSSMSAGGRWDFTRAALLDVADRFGALARLGVRAFPGVADGCAAADLAPPAFANRDAFERIAAPDQLAQTPIAAAFEGVLDAFGDPDEGEAVVLITDGDETCQEELAALTQVELLRRRGVRTFAVGISQQANGELLGRIAAAGGTVRVGLPGWYLVREAAELEAALSDVFDRLEVCACLPADRACEGDTRLACSEQGDGLVPAEQCPFGCHAGACYPLCRPGGDTIRCADATRLACNATGDSFEPAEQCAWGCDEQLGCLPPPTVDSCRYDAPLQVRAATGLDLSLSGLLYHQGLTDRGPGPDPAPRIRVEVGYGPAGAPPEDPTWVWQAADPDWTWDDLAADLPGWDRYAATVPVPAEGAWDLASRASVSGGAAWTVCDRGPGGSDDGFASAAAGHHEAVAEALCVPGEWVCDDATANRCGPGGVDFVEELACDPRFGCAPGDGCRDVDYRFDVQRELPDAVMADWRVCHASRYDEGGFAMDDIRAACDGNVIAYGCRRIGLPDWRIVAMGERDVVFDVTGDGDEVNDHNGAEWYYGPNSGIGFTRTIGPTIDRSINGCDTEMRYGTYRLCWFTAGDVLGNGYRCGSDFSLDGNPLWERRIWTVP